MGVETCPRKQILSFLPPPSAATLILLFIIAAVGGCAARRQRHTHGFARLSLLEELKPNLSCPNGWEQGPTGNRCFLFVNMSSSWEDSETSCRNRSGHLASLTSESELLFIRSRCFSSPCWVGGKESNSSNGKAWKWIDCHVHWNVSGPGNCTSSCAQDHCLFVSRTPGLVRESCAASHPFVCVLTTTESDCVQSSTKNRKTYLIVLIAVSCLILTTTLAIVLWLLLYRRTKKKRRRRAAAGASSSMEPLASLRLFTADELRMATNSFSIQYRLRGNTFKGMLPDGSLVAVKKLERPSFQAKKEFLAEMNRLARLRHPNLVAMLGCCYDHGERFIVYSFIANGPLDLWLHDPVRRGTLDWRTRMRIAITAAQGLAYLHDQVKPHVIHRDVKASSILLDESFNGHFMGVGLANVVPWEAAYERTVVAGTHGYLAPEFVYRNELTTKSDVYSFGVVMLELISGRKPAMPVDVVDWQTIFEWATPLVQSQRLMEIIDPVMRSSSSSSSSSSSVPAVSQIQRLVDLIYSCTQHVPSMRPRMSYVVHQLQLVDAEAMQEEGVRQLRFAGVECLANPSAAAAAAGLGAGLLSKDDGEPALISVQSEIIESLF